MANLKYGSLQKEASDYWRWHLANPPSPMDSMVAQEGAGSELRSLLFHVGTVMPVYLSIIRQLENTKIKKGMRLIELGCGSGRLLGYLKLKFPELEIWGVDYSAGCIAYAQKEYGYLGVKFVHTPAQQTVLPANYFDYVISSHVIEHIPESEGGEFLREARRISKRGGVTYVGTPERRMSQNLYHPNPTDDPRYRLVPPHEHEYTLGELKALAQKVGGKKVRVDQLSNPLFRQIFRRSINSFKPGNKLSQQVKNSLYRMGRDMLPKLAFDWVTKTGSMWQVKRAGLSWKKLLLANEISKESKRKISDNLLLVFYK